MKKSQSLIVFLVILMMFMGMFTGCSSTPQVAEKTKAVAVSTVDTSKPAVVAEKPATPKVVAPTPAPEKPAVVVEKPAAATPEKWEIKGFSVSMNGKLIMDSISGQGMPKLDKSYEATIDLYPENTVKLNVSGLGDVVTGTYDLQNDGWVLVKVDYLNKDVFKGLLDLLNISMSLEIVKEGYWFKLVPDETKNYAYVIASAFDRKLAILAVPAM